MKITVIKGSFFGKERKFSSIVAITPLLSTVEEIFSYGIGHHFFERAPKNYQVEVLDENGSRELQGSSILIMIPGYQNCM